MDETILYRITTIARFGGATVGVGNGVAVMVTTGKVVIVTSDGEDISVTLAVLIGD